MTSALEEGEGVLEKAAKVREARKGGCVKMRTRGGWGPKMKKNCGRHKWMAPQLILSDNEGFLASNSRTDSKI